MSDNNSNKLNNNKYNPYAKYLPENRMKKETDIDIKTTKKISKISLFAFWGSALVFLVIIGLWFNGNILRTEARVYNLSLGEGMNLDTLYSAPGVEWTSKNDNVIIENNVVVAKNSGDAYIYATVDNKIVKDVNINVLTGEEAISLDNHSMIAKVGDKKSFVVMRNKSKTIDDNYISPRKKFMDFFHKLLNKLLPKNDNDIQQQR